MRPQVEPVTLDSTTQHSLKVKEQDFDQAEFTAKVQNLIQQYCEDKIKAAEYVGESYANLWKEIGSYLSGGGKMIRPHLVGLAYSSYGGEDIDSIVPIACAWELLHSFLLVHDDIIDRDLVRHGRPNIAGMYYQKYKKLSKTEAYHYAQSYSLLAGDLLLAASYELVNGSNLKPEAKLQVCSYLQSAIFYTAGGEFIDVESVVLPIEESRPDAIIENKTTIYSFQLPLQCGAYLAGASANEIQKLAKISLDLGYIFQLRDDQLGVFGKEEETGKSNRSDIKEKKRTLLVKLTKNNLVNKEKDRLEQLYGFNHEMTDEESEEVFNIISASGAKVLIEQEISNRTESISKLILELKIPKNSQEAFLKIMHNVSKRSN